MSSDSSSRPEPIAEIARDIPIAEAARGWGDAPARWLPDVDGGAVVLVDDLKRALALGLLERPVEVLARTDLPGLSRSAPDDVGVRRGATALGWEVELSGSDGPHLVRRQIDLQPVATFSVGALAAALPPAVFEVLDDLGKFAAEWERDVFAVGGLVRDLVLESSAHEPDVDVVVAGDAIALARAWAQARHYPVTTHVPFGTATVVVDPSLTVDLATMRRERYSAPGALPRVEPGTLLDDLHRRDFTVNALAMRLNHPDAGAIIDPLGGWEDLRHGVLRVHHPLTFIDDPTRLLRAARYRARFGLRTGADFDRARKLALETRSMESVSGARVFADLARSFREPDPGESLRLLAAEGILAAIDDGLSFTETTSARISQVSAAQTAWPAPLSDLEWPIPCVAALSWDWSAEQLERLRKRLDPPGRVGARLELEIPRMRGLSERLEHAADLKPSDVHRLLGGLPESMLMAASVFAGEVARQRIRRFVDEWRHVAIATNGQHLKQLGLGPGPMFGAIQQRLLAARLDGEVHDLASELALVRCEFVGPRTP